MDFVLFPNRGLGATKCQLTSFVYVWTCKNYIHIYTYICIYVYIHIHTSIYTYKYIFTHHSQMREMLCVLPSSWFWYELTSYIGELYYSLISWWYVWTVCKVRNRWDMRGIRYPRRFTIISLICHVLRAGSSIHAIPSNVWWFTTKLISRYKTYEFFYPFQVRPNTTYPSSLRLLLALMTF